MASQTKRFERNYFLTWFLRSPCVLKGPAKTVDHLCSKEEFFFKNLTSTVKDVYTEDQDLPLAAASGFSQHGSRCLHGPKRDVDHGLWSLRWKNNLFWSHFCDIFDEESVEAFGRCWHMPLVLAFRRQRQGNLCEFEASLSTRAAFRTGFKATHRNPISKNQVNK